MKMCMTIACVLFGIAAHAETKDFKFDRVEQDGKTISAGDAIANVDLQKKSIQVVIYNDPCGALREEDPSLPPQMHCMAMPAPLESFEVPLKSVSKGNCGETIYAGENLKNALVDGIGYDVSISDNSVFNCETIAPVPTAEMSVRRTGGHAADVNYSATKGGFIGTTPWPEVPQLPSIVDTKGDDKIFGALSSMIKTTSYPSASYSVKSAGRLTCKSLVPKFSKNKPSFECDLAEADQNGSDDQEIYEALNVQERLVNNHGILGVGKTQKRVGRLICTKSYVISPAAKATYFCDLGK